jgi:hypothetical protein
MLAAVGDENWTITALSLPVRQTIRTRNALAIGVVVTIDVTLRVSASLQAVWDVLTDFDRRAEIVTNLQSSKVTRSATTVIVTQDG